MIIFRILLLVLMSLSLSEICLAVSVGAKSDGHLGLSVYAPQQNQMGIHVAASLAPGESAKIDIETHFSPLEMRMTKILGTSFFIQPYYGMGIRGEADSKEAMHENFFIKTPLGFLLTSHKYTVESFLDVSPMLGELPKLKSRFLGRVGVRTKL